MNRKTPEPQVALPNGKISRRSFLKFCGLMAATLALPTRYIETISKALATANRLPVIWLEFQDCTGDSESFLRAAPRISPLDPGVNNPGIVDLLLDAISVDYHETLMVPAGAMSEKSLTDTMQNYAGQYLAIVEGAIPIAQDGVYCTIRGRTALSIAHQVLPGARAVIALGSCAWDGGLPSAAPNLTGAVGVQTAVPGLANFAALPGCPSNVINLAATIVHLITFNELPPRESDGRPYFAYGQEIHEHCERHDFYEEDQFVLEWGDQGHRNGWCLFKMGCKGPETDSNCPSVKWNDGTCWPIGAGHGCIGCTTSHFWDQKTPFYQELPDD
jgi:hydrogenase small subunit